VEGEKFQSEGLGEMEEITEIGSKESCTKNVGNRSTLQGMIITIIIDINFIH
jgi:hypothetical protein